MLNSRLVKVYIYYVSTIYKVLILVTILFREQYYISEEKRINGGT